jgi:hypothetical protein
MKLDILFYECEHPGDLNNYADDITSCGGNVVHKEVCCDSETGRVIVSVEDKNEFVFNFKKTESFDFSYMTENNELL